MDCIGDASFDDLQYLSALLADIFNARDGTRTHDHPNIKSAALPSEAYTSMSNLTSTRPESREIQSVNSFITSAILLTAHQLRTKNLLRQDYRELLEFCKYFRSGRLCGRRFSVLTFPF